MVCYNMAKYEMNVTYSQRIPLSRKDQPDSMPLALTAGAYHHAQIILILVATSESLPITYRAV